MNNNKKIALDFEEQSKFNFNLIIPNKTYTVKELGSIFDYNILILIDDKKTLLDLKTMAVESGKRKFIDIVNSVIKRKFEE